ncbi:MAG: LuxR C-terminal-related transcriptional regulator [Solirubrobacteraceae bacterium]
MLAETTVKGYIASLLEKLGASSRLQAVVRAHEAGLI